MQLSCSKDWTSLNWAFTPGPWSKKHQPPVAVDRKRNHDGLSFWPRTQSLECQFQKEEHCIEPWQTNNLQNIWMFVRTKWWNCSCSCWHNQSSPIFVSSAPGHSPLSLGTGHSWPHIFHQKKTSKVQKEKLPRSLLKFPVFFPVVSGTVFVWILWMATRHWCLTTRGIPTPAMFKEDPLRIAGKCKFTIAIIHIIIIWIFICLMICLMFCFMSWISFLKYIT